MTPNDIQQRLQRVIRRADGKLTVGEVTRELVLLLAALTVAEELDEEQIVLIYGDTCQQLREARDLLSDVAEI